MILIDKKQGLNLYFLSTILPCLRHQTNAIPSAFLRITCLHQLHLYIQILYFPVLSPIMFSTPGPSTVCRFLRNTRIIIGNQKAFNTYTSSQTRCLQRVSVQGDVKGCWS